MKFTTMLVSALATLTAAFPTVDKRVNANLTQGNNLQGLNNLQGFKSQDLNYLLAINALDLQLLETLGSVNNFNILSFQQLFASNQFNLQNILQLAQLQQMLQLAQLGVFNGFDLSTLNLASLQLGLVNNVGLFDLSQFIQASSLPQIQAIAAQITVI